MLDAFIIEEIKRRERLRREQEQRPAVELPVPRERPEDRRSDTPAEDGPKRGVVVIDLAV